MLLGIDTGLWQTLREYFLLAFLLLSILIGYLAVSPRLATKIYRPKLFNPLPMQDDFAVPTINHVQGEEVELTERDGTKIVLWFFQLPETRRIILFSHGNGGNMMTKMPLIEVLLRIGVSVLAYDYSGYGKSSGSPDPRKICDNALTVYDYLVSTKGIKPQEIILYGESLGAAVSAELATKHPVRALIIQSGFVSLKDIGREKIPFLRFYPEWLFPQPSLNAGRLLRELKLPILILHGVNDPVVPYHHGESLFQLASEPKQFVSMPETGHSDFLVQQPELFCGAIKRFLAELE